MRHRNNKNKLNMHADHRKALIRNIATAVILYEKVKTTEKRAKLVAPVVEKLISIAKKKDDMNAIRKINSIVLDKNAAKKIMADLKKKYEGKTSGFVRISKIGFRNGDNAPLAIVELT